MGSLSRKRHNQDQRKQRGLANKVDLDLEPPMPTEESTNKLVDFWNKRKEKIR